MSTDDKKVRLIATVRLLLGGRSLIPGDPFLANEVEAKSFLRMHFAIAAPDDETPPVIEDEAAARPSRRPYKRRDMEAETFPPVDKE